MTADVKSAAGLTEVLEAVAVSDPAGRVPLIVVGVDVHLQGSGSGHTLTSAVVSVTKPCLPDALVWQARQLLGIREELAPEPLPSAEVITLWRVDELECLYRARSSPDGCSHLEVRRGPTVIWVEQTASALEAHARSDQLKHLAKRLLL